jgi:hypothetical protein
MLLHYACFTRSVRLLEDLALAPDADRDRAHDRAGPAGYTLQHVSELADTSTYMKRDILVSHWIHIRNASGYMYLGLFIKRYIFDVLHQRYTEIQNNDTCILDAS